MKEIEIWKPIKDYEGLYEVSNLGRVKSLEKTLKNRFNYYKTKEKILKQNIWIWRICFSKNRNRRVKSENFCYSQISR